MTHYANEPQVEPDLSAHGRAWKYTGPVGRGGIGSWLVNAPHGRFTWTWWLISAIHLRPVEGEKDPRIDFPGASHEVMFLPLDPNHPLPDLDGEARKAHWLYPIDLEHQVILSSDKDAEELLKLCVMHILRGASPDSQHRAAWVDIINKTAEHFRLGDHPQ